MADFSRRVLLDELRGRGLLKGFQPEVLEQIPRWPSAHARGDEACTQLIAYTDGSACMTRAWPRLAAEAWWGAVIFAVDASGVWRLAGGVWGPVETDPAAQLSLDASRPTSPVAEVTAIASVPRMLRAARVSIPLTILSDSQYALGVVVGEDRALSEIRLVQLARSEARCYRQRAGIEGHHVAAHRGLLATRLLTDWRMLAAGGRWLRSFFQSQRYLSLRWPIGRGRSVEAFSGWQTVSRGCGAYLRVRQCPHAASRRAQCGFSSWSSCHDWAARRSR